MAGCDKFTDCLRCLAHGCFWEMSGNCRGLPSYSGEGFVHPPGYGRLGPESCPEESCNFYTGIGLGVAITVLITVASAVTYIFASRCKKREKLGDISSENGDLLL